MRHISRLHIYLERLRPNGVALWPSQQTRMLHAVCPIGVQEESSGLVRQQYSKMESGSANLLTGRTTAAAHLQLHHPFSSVSSTEGMPEMPEEEFHGVADTLLETLHETMDTLVENEDIPDSDVEYSQGVLTIRLGPNGIYVYNKQTPNRQIWMSSPVSGPVRYDYMDGRWIYKHDDHELKDRLRSELSGLLGKDVSDVL